MRGQRCKCRCRWSSFKASGQFPDFAIAIKGRVAICDISRRSVHHSLGFSGSDKPDDCADKGVVRVFISLAEARELEALSVGRYLDSEEMKRQAGK